MLIFGYGSLMHPDGINCRGLSRHYTDHDLIPVRLSGFQRSWNAAWDGKLFLGVTPVAGIRATPINGVLFSLDDDDLDAFMVSEGSSDEKGLYSLMPVTDRIHGFSSSPIPVHTCVTRRPNQNGVVPCYYQHSIRKALDLWGPEFKREFMETTDWSTFRYEIRSHTLGDYHYLISEWQELLVK